MELIAVTFGVVALEFVLFRVVELGFVTFGEVTLGVVMLIKVVAFKHTSFTESHFVSQATQLLSPSRYGVVIGHEHFKVDGSMTKPLGQRRQVNV